MQRLFSYVYPNVPSKDLSVQDLAGTIVKGLRIRKRRVLPTNLVVRGNSLPLKRIADTNGNTSKKLPVNQQSKRSKGSSKQRTCFTCKRYQFKYIYCVGACPRCGTAVCLTNNRTVSCLDEHLTSTDPLLRCNGRQKVRFPPESRLYTPPAAPL